MTNLKNARIWIYFVIILMASTVCGTAEATPVFPGAQGFGTDTKAAYGLAPRTNPTIYKVTSLSADPNVSGTLGYALQQSGPRVVIFEVSGTIDGTASGVDEWWIKNPYLTVAGQTAPSPGITLKGIRIIIRTHDVLLQHIRIRLGDMIKRGEGLSWMQNRDCISIGNFKGSDAYNIVVDHCSFSWSMDENVEVYNNDGGDVHDITISNSIISEGLYKNVRCDYDPSRDHHSKGLLIGHQNSPENISVIGTLFAHNQDRNPVLSDGIHIVVNNLVYNPQRWGINAYATKDVLKISVVGNVIIPGLNSGKYVDCVLSLGNKSWYNDGKGSEVYVSDNKCVNCGVDPWDGVDDRSGFKGTVKVYSPIVWPKGLTAKPTSEVRASVLANSGARPGDRDPVDQRIVNDVSAGTGKFIDSQSDVGGWPNLAVNHRTLTLPTNPHGDADSDGYTNLEEWLHSLAAKVAGTSEYIEAPKGLSFLNSN